MSRWIRGDEWDPGTGNYDTLSRWQGFNRLDFVVYEGKLGIHTGVLFILEDDEVAELRDALTNYLETGSLLRRED